MTLTTTLERHLPWAAPLLAVTVTLALAAIAYRGTPRIGFDPHYYVEYAKAFRTELPHSFGTAWPFGYPLLGTAVSRTGLSVFASLIVVLACGALGIYGMVWRPLCEAIGSRRLATGLVLGLATTAILPIELGAARSEIIFTLCFLAAVSTLAAWPAPRAIVGAALAAVLSFAMRYAGVLTLATLGIWTIACWPQLQVAGRRRLAIAAVAAAVAVCVGFLWLNQHVNGTATGMVRGHGDLFTNLGPDAVDFGWGGLIALSTIGLRQPFAAHTAVYAFVGGSVFVAVLYLAFCRWRRPVSVWSRPLALGLAVYLLGMWVLCAYDGFDRLYNARFFLPALPPVLVLLGESVRAFPRVGSAVLMLAMTAPGVAVCVRGVSPAVSYNFTSAAAQLAPRLLPGDRVGVNIHACGLSAWLDCPVTRIDDCRWQEAVQLYRFVVVTGVATDRTGLAYEWPDEAQALLADLRQTRAYREIARWPGCVLLERVAKAGNP
jgi:hypothetical protein